MLMIRTYLLCLQITVPGLNAKDLNVNISVGGAIEGMTKDNQDQVNESIKDWFRKGITTNMLVAQVLTLLTINIEHRRLDYGCD